MPVFSKYLFIWKLLAVSKYLEDGAPGGGTVSTGWGLSALISHN